MAAGSESWSARWKGCKKAFETNTNKRKKPNPTGTFFGITYRKGTGISDALKKCDAARNDYAKLKTALAEFRAKKHQWILLLCDQVKAGDDEIYKGEVARIRLDAETLESDISEQLEILEHKLR